MEFGKMMEILAHSAMYTTVTFAFMYMAKMLDDARTKDIDEDYEIAENNNMAIAVRRFGLYVAYAIAFAGTLSGQSKGLGNDMLNLSVDGILITIFLFTARSINDRIQLSGMDNDDEVKNGNIAAGLAECGILIATGLVLNGSFSGADLNGSTIVSGAVSATIFFVLGQIGLLATGLCYQIITPFDVRKEIGKKNTAAGVALAGMLIAIGIIMRACVAGDSAGLANDMMSFGVYMVYGIILLLVFRKMIDIFLLPSTDLTTEVERDQNAAALTLVQGALIAVAIIIAAVI